MVIYPNLKKIIVKQNKSMRLNNMKSLVFISTDKLLNFEAGSSITSLNE